MRTRMTKEQKMLADRLKNEEKDREVQVATDLENKSNRRKMGRGAELGIARRVAVSHSRSALFAST